MSRHFLYSLWDYSTVGLWLVYSACGLVTPSAAAVTVSVPPPPLPFQLSLFGMFSPLWLLSFTHLLSEVSLRLMPRPASSGLSVTAGFPLVSLGLRCRPLLPLRGFFDNQLFSCQHSHWLHWHRVGVVVDYADTCRKSHWLRDTITAYSLTMRTPTANFKGFSQILKEQSLSIRWKKYLDVFTHRISNNFKLWKPLHKEKIACPRSCWPRGNAVFKLCDRT